MKSLFLLSNTYTIKTLILCSAFLFSDEVDRIIIYSENCAINEHLKSSTKTKILILNNIEDCIAQSDVILVDSSNVPEKTQFEVISRAKKLRKQYYFADLTNKIVSKMPDINDEYNNIPTIVILPLGDYSQTSYIELILTRILADMDVYFDFKYTDNTLSILQSVNEIGLLNSNVRKALPKENINPQLLVLSKKTKNVTELKKQIDFVRKISPDFVIVLSDNDFVNIEDLKQYFHCACFSNIDLVIKSHFHTSVGTYTVYCNDPISSNEGVLDIESENLYKLLLCRIQEKLSYPYGIKPEG